MITFYSSFRISTASIDLCLCPSPDAQIGISIEDACAFEFSSEVFFQERYRKATHPIDPLRKVIRGIGYRIRQVAAHGSNSISIRIRREYNEDMARGWESKSVEAQIEESSSESSATQDQNLSPDERQALIKKNDLLLSRLRIVQQLEGSTSERYSEFLRHSLADLEAQIAALS